MRTRKVALFILMLVALWAEKNSYFVIASVAAGLFVFILLLFVYDSTPGFSSKESEIKLLSEVEKHLPEWDECNKKPRLEALEKVLATLPYRKRYMLKRACQKQYEFYQDFDEHDSLRVEEIRRTQSWNYKHMIEVIEKTL